MEEIARVYSEALFEVAKEKGALDEVHEQLGEIADAVSEDRDLQVFFFSPYFSSSEKRDGIAKAVSGANEELVNFLELLAEKHRMPALFRIRRRFDELWSIENERLDVTVTSAVELDPAVVKSIGERDREEDRQEDRADQRGRRRDHRRDRPPGRQPRARREHQQPPREAAQGGLSGGLIRPEGPATNFERRRTKRHGNQARRDLIDPEAADRGPRHRQRRSLRGRNRPLDRRRDRPRPRPRQLHVARDARAAPRRDRPRAQPRGGQRRRRAVRRLGGDRRGRHGQAHRTPARDPGRRGAARPAGRPARSPARRQGRHQHLGDAPGRVQGTRRGPAPGRQGAAADRAEGDRLDDPDRPRPARADHRRPPDRQDGDRDRHDHQQQGRGRRLGLRRDRAADGDGRPADEHARGGGRDGEHDHRRRPRRRGRADQVHGALRRHRDGRVLHLQGRPLALHLRRPHQARLRVPADVAAAAAAARSRGLPR